MGASASLRVPASADCLSRVFGVQAPSGWRAPCVVSVGIRFLLVDGNLQQIAWSSPRLLIQAFQPSGRSMRAGSWVEKTRLSV